MSEKPNHDCALCGVQLVIDCDLKEMLENAKREGILAGLKEAERVAGSVLQEASMWELGALEVRNRITRLIEVRAVADLEDSPWKLER